MTTNTVTLETAAHAVIMVKAVEDGSATLADSLAIVWQAVDLEGIGVRALSTECKTEGTPVSPATVSRYAAAGYLLATLAGCKGTPPAYASPDWALRMTREGAKGGAGVGAVRAECGKSHKSAAALASAVQSLATGRKVDAEEKATREARPNDGTDKPADGAEGTEVPMTPAQEALVHARALAKILNAEGKGWTAHAEDLPVFGKIRSSVDTAARRLDQITDKVGPTVPAPEVTVPA